jgi:4-diphosphocytidyl-2-C-methyl-D-erythritol kinase
MSINRQSSTTGVTVLSFAKINLGLKIIGRRADGFHEVRTVYQTIDLSDRLSFRRRRDDRVVLQCHDPCLPLSTDNLVVRAAELWMEKSKIRRGVTVTLEKRIPTGAGLGGGSGNAATTLMALERLWGPKLSEAALFDLAATLGSDVPFFLLGGRVLGAGRGEELFPLPDLKPLTLLLASPGLLISTREAYQKASLRLTKRRLANNIARFRAEVFEKESAFALFENDFESALFPEYPELRRLKRALLAAGAQRAQMTGSGSTVFGVFPSVPTARRAEKELQSSQSTSTLLTFVVRSIPRSQYKKRVFAAGE